MIFEILEATGRLQEVGAIAYVLYSIYGELRWTPHEGAGAWRAPAIIGLIGAVSLWRTLSPDGSAFDLALVGLAILIALGAGIVAGRIAAFRPLSPDTRARLVHRRAQRPSRGRGTDATPRPLPHLEVRTGVLGAVLWVVAFAGRYGIEAWAEHLDSPLAETAGLGLLIAGLTEGARVATLALREPKVEGRRGEGAKG